MLKMSSQNRCIGSKVLAITRMGRFCLLVELHWEGLVPAACAAVFFFFFYKVSVSELMRNDSVYRTAPATPGLLMILVSTNSRS